MADGNMLNWFTVVAEPSLGAKVGCQGAPSFSLFFSSGSCIACMTTTSLELMHLNHPTLLADHIIDQLSAKGCDFSDLLVDLVSIISNVTASQHGKRTTGNDKC